MIFDSNRIAASIACALFAASAGAASPALRDIQGSANIAGSIDSLVGPDGKANVIIVMKQQPGAVAFSTALHRGGGGVVGETAANAAAKSAISAAAVQQQSMMDALQSTQVNYVELYRVQRALNGVALRVAPADMAALRKLPGVERVDLLPLDHPTAGYNIPFIKAPQLWEGTPLGLVGMKGEGIRIGIIDTGIDYVHPNFGGSGLLAAYQNINPTSNTGVDLSTVFPTAKVVGGIDLAGDAYTANNAPVPDPNPMDCNGHGSHVAGIAAGYGVNNDGSSYGGPWTTVPDYTGLRIAPGVAPQAQLYAIRVFGCGGSTALTVDAIDWAMDPNGDMDFSDRLDVINMSLGSDYGLPFDDSAVAADNASSTGMIVVASAGNAGDTFFVHGSPAGGNSVIAVASTQDSGQIGPLLVNVPGGIAGYYPTGTAQFGVGAPLAGLTSDVVRVDDGTAAAGGGTINDGCETPFTNAAALAGKIALVDRGVCGFKLKAYNAQLNGAVGVIIANVAGSGNPTVAPNMANDPLVPAVTIPVTSVNFANGNLLRTNIATLNATLTNGADTASSFTSRGPYGADGTIYLKPDISAPGSNITSTQTGKTCTGTGSSTGCLLANASGYIAGGASLVLSGTSMAAPHVAGLMALVRQLNPSASVEELKALAMNTAAHDISLGPNGLLGTYAASRVGSGRIDAALAATDKVIAFNADVPGAVSVTFANEVIGTASATHTVRIENHTAAPQSLTLSLDPILTSPGVTFSIVGSTALSLPPSGSATVQIKMDATGDQMKRSLDPTMSAVLGLFSFAGSLPRDYIAESASLLKVSKDATELARVPVYMVHRPHSDMSAVVGTPAATPSGTVNVSLVGTDVCTATRGAGTCTGDFGSNEVSLVSPFELQYAGSRDESLPGFANLKYVGVNYDSTNDEYLFGVSTFGKWGSPTDVAFDVCIDTDKDGKYDKVLFSSNTGTVAQRVIGNTSASGQDIFITTVFTPPTSLTITDLVNADTADNVDSALHDNNVMVLGGYAVDIGVAAGGASFNYAIAICPGYNPLCVRLNTPNRTCTAGGNAYAEIPQTFTYNGANPGITTGGGAFFSPVALAPDLAGTDLAVGYDFGKMSANGSTGTLLLLHHHNDGGNSAEVVVLDELFHDGFESN